MRVRRATGTHLPRAVLAVALLVALNGCNSDNAASSRTSPSPSGSTASKSSAPPGLSLVAIGDSIPYNSPDDCPGCTGFVDRYAKAIEAATGKHVEVKNHSLHTGLTLPELLDDHLADFREDLTAADIIVVGIAHNSNELNVDQPCGKPLVNDLPDWSAMTAKCAVDSADASRPRFEQLYSTIAEWRDGKPTILRTINRYNDWIGFADIKLTPAQERKTAKVIAEWNRVLCKAAEDNAFQCGDVSRAFNGPDGMKPSGDLLAADYTHPSDKGNARIDKVLNDLGYSFES
jgi:hypothetical protein